MKQQRYKAVASMLLTVLQVLAGPVQGNSIAAPVERPDSSAQSETKRDTPGETRSAEIGGSAVFWVLGGGLVVVSLLARRKSAGIRLLPWKR